MQSLPPGAQIPVIFGEPNPSSQLILGGNASSRLTGILKGHFIVWIFTKYLAFLILRTGYHRPGVAAWIKSGVASLRTFRRGTRVFELWNCVDVCGCEMGVVITSAHTIWSLSDYLSMEKLFPTESVMQMNLASHMRSPSQSYSKPSFTNQKKSSKNDNIQEGRKYACVKPDSFA